jgi:septal ring-binding cell division protein DamX
MTPTTPEPAVSATPPPPAPPTPAAARATPGTVPTPAPAASAGTQTLAEARALLRRGQHKEAARVFANSLRQSAPGGFSIQLLVACSDETVGKALAAVPDPDLYILPVNYKGRPCFRVCWGLYDSEQRAESATRAVPDYFRNSGTTPRVVPTSGLLP